MAWYGFFADSSNHLTGPVTESLGFGVFYLIVNIGGFLGPVISGLLRNEFGWPAVFRASAPWIALNVAVLFLFYREPEAGHEHDRPSSAGAKRRRAVDDMVRIVGNGRLFVTALVGLVRLMLAGRGRRGQPPVRDRMRPPETRCAPTTSAPSPKSTRRPCSGSSRGTRRRSPARRSC